MDNHGLQTFNVQEWVESPSIMAVEGLVAAINSSVFDWLDPNQLTLLFQNRNVLPLSNFVLAGEVGLYYILVSRYFDENVWQDQPGPRHTYTPNYIQGHDHVFNATVAVAFEGHGQVYIRRTIRRRQLYGILTIIHYRRLP
ncbi:unnamed protein product [Cochlearia groenlandica]